MNKTEMTFSDAKRWILQNYFDGDENVQAVTAGDEEACAMARAVEALELAERILEKS